NGFQVGCEVRRLSLAHSHDSIARMVDATYDLPFAVSRSRWLYHKVPARSHSVTLLASNLRFLACRRRSSRPRFESLRGSSELLHERTIADLRRPSCPSRKECSVATNADSSMAWTWCRPNPTAHRILRSSRGRF